MLSYFIPFLSKLLIGVEDLTFFPDFSSLYHYDAIRLPILSHLLVSCKNQQNPVDACFFQDGIEELVYDRIFQIILCCILI